MAPTLVHDLGGYLREQRMAAQMSLRQLSELAGISNPYLSQIERGLKKPSAEILQQIARGLRVSAESLYVRAGFLDEAPTRPTPAGVLEAIEADAALTPRQRAVLVEVYRSFVAAPAGSATPAPAGDTDAPGATAVPPPAPTRPGHVPLARPVAAATTTH